MRGLRAFVVVVGLVAAQLALQASPAYACSCRADVPVADALAESDAAFVGVYTGRDDPFVQGPLISSGRPVINHFDVERTVKGDIVGRVEVVAAAGGATCGLELEVGERTGLFLQRTETGWRSSLCSQTEPAGLLAFAPAVTPVPAAQEEPSERGFFVAVAVVALALMAFFIVQRRLDRRTRVRID
jgi:hypothetical protein